jgi:hypothetical protein
LAGESAARVDHVLPQSRVNAEASDLIADHNVDGLRQLNPFRVLADHVNTIGETIDAHELAREPHDAPRVYGIDAPCASFAGEKAQDGRAGAEIEDDVSCFDNVLKGAAEGVETNGVTDVASMVLELGHYFIRAHGVTDSVRVLPPDCVRLATLPYSTSSGRTHGLRDGVSGEGVSLSDTWQLQEADSS